jgi:hypothetical protein
MAKYPTNETHTLQWKECIPETYLLQEELKYNVQFAFQNNAEALKN